MENRRVLLAVVLCLATLFVWYRLFPPPAPPEVAQKPGTVSAPAGGEKPQAAAQPLAAPASPASPAPALPQEQLTVVERPGMYKAVVTSHGAALQSFELLSRKNYTKDMRRMVLRPGATQPEIERRQTDGPTNLVTSYRPSLWIRFPRNAFGFPDDPQKQPWVLTEDATTPSGGRRLVYRWQSGDASLQKTLEFPPSAFQVSMMVEVKNLKGAPVSHHFEVGLEGFQDPTQRPGGIFSARVVQNELAWDRSGKMQSEGLEGVLERIPADKLRGDLRWIGIGQQYFLLAAALPHGARVGDKQGRASGETNGLLSISAEYSEKTLSAGESAVYPVVLFAGPKLPEYLDEVSVDGQSAGLSTSINYQTLPVLGWLAEPLVRPMLWVMRKIYGVTHSWALAIVLLTMLVKLITLYPTQKSMKSMQAMAKLRPEVELLEKKHGKGTEKFNLEVMALYKRHNINPIGGCLPMLLQMPIWIALYSMLSSAIELYREPFVTPRWISDMTLADPYFILPLATGFLMYLQTKLSPPPSDAQQRMMANMMPAFFTFLSLFLPAGLALYILTNTVLGMVQQAVINRGGMATASAAVPTK